MHCSQSTDHTSCCHDMLLYEQCETELYDQTLRSCPGQSSANLESAGSVMHDSTPPSGLQACMIASHTCSKTVQDCAASLQQRCCTYEMTTLTKLFFCCRVAPASRRSACCSCTGRAVAAVLQRGSCGKHVRNSPRPACCQAGTKKQLDLVLHTCCSLLSRRYLQTSDSTHSE